MRFLIVLGLGATFLRAEPAPILSVPWLEGEKLTYTVDWGLLHAAQGVFEVRTQGDAWKFTLSLESQGSVDYMYPFRDVFSSITQKNPWRSIQYTENRREPKRVLTDDTQLDYPAHKGERVIVNTSEHKREVHAIDYTHDALDDLGSMLYRLRAEPWQPGEKKTLYVYESNSEKEGNVEFAGREQRLFGAWPMQSMLKIVAKPGKGTHRRGGLVLWLTDDARRLPLHADLLFKYGTFTIDLLKAETVPPVSTPVPLH